LEKSQSQNKMAKTATATKPSTKKAAAKKTAVKKTDAAPKKSILKKTDPSKKNVMKKTAQVKKTKDAKKTIAKTAKPKEKKSILKKSKKKTDEGNIALEPEKQTEFNEVLDSLNEEDCKPGTLYIGHIPHGFYEQQMRDYFTQFGTVLKVRLARSKKSGGYKGYGFIQFASDDVAEIAAEAMDGYLMFDRLLQCKVMSSHAQHRNIWKGANKKFVYQNRAERDQKLKQRVRTAEQNEKVVKRLVDRDERRRRKLEDLGIDYQFPSVEEQLKDSNGNEVVAGEQKSEAVVEAKDVEEKEDITSAAAVEQTSEKISKKKRKRTEDE